MPSWLVCRARTAIRGLGAPLCMVLAAAALILSHVPVRADDLAGFNAAVEDFTSHNRVAIGYLRTGSNELAAVELEKMKSAWNKVMATYGAAPPAALKGNPRYKATLIEIQNNIADALALADSGQTGTDTLTSQRANQIRNSLQRIREQLSAMRKASKVTVLADCVLDANRAMAAIFSFEDTPPNLYKPYLATKGKALGAVVRRCDGMADETVRKNPEFRRLIDGTLNSLTFIPKVIANKDREMLIRVIGELRAFDNLLLFRYG